MEVEIVFLDVFKYTDKKTGTDKCAFEYFVRNENFKINTSKLKGVKPVTYWLDDVRLFDMIDVKYTMQNAILVIDEQPSAFNPLKKQLIVKSIKFKDTTINLG